MPLSRKALLALLDAIDNQLGRRITIVAVGGTALTLLGAKESSIDIDFAFPDNELHEFDKALGKLPKIGFRIDCFRDGTIFDVTLRAFKLQDEPSRLC